MNSKTKAYLSDITISRHSLLKRLCKEHYDYVLFNRSLDNEECTLKQFADILISSILLNFIPQGARILEVGGGHSRVLANFKSDYECWNLDPFEGNGNGPLSVPESLKGVRIVREYAGAFSAQLPNEYFDFVFSISALEHVPFETGVSRKVIDDINRVTKPNGLHVHCMDTLLPPPRKWLHPIVTQMFQMNDTINQFVPLKDISHDADVYVLPKSDYDRSWKGKPGMEMEFENFGRPISYQVCWHTITG